MKERVWLREKSTLMEVEVNKLEGEIKKAFLDKKIGVINQGTHDYSDKFWDCHWEVISLMRWIGTYITKGITHGGVMQIVKCMMQIVKIKGRFFPGKVMDDWLKPYTSGMTA